MWQYVFHWHLDDLVEQYRERNKELFGTVLCHQVMREEHSLMYGLTCCYNQQDWAGANEMLADYFDTQDRHYKELCYEKR